MRTLYVSAHPDRAEFARGYACGIEQSNDDDEVEVVVQIDDTCPRDKVYVTDKPLTNESAR